MEKEVQMTIPLPTKNISSLSKLLRFRESSHRHGLGRDEVVGIPGRKDKGSRRQERKNDLVVSYFHSSLVDRRRGTIPVHPSVTEDRVVGVPVSAGQRVLPFHSHHTAVVGVVGERGAGH